MALAAEPLAGSAAVAVAGESSADCFVDMLSGEAVDSSESNAVAAQSAAYIKDFCLALDASFQKSNLLATLG